MILYIGINNSKQIELLEFEKLNLSKQNNKSILTISKIQNENKSLNQTINSLQYTIEEFRKNFAKTEIQFDNELKSIESELKQCNNQSNNLLLIKDNYERLIKNNKPQQKIQLQENQQKYITNDLNSYNKEIIPIVIPTCNRINYLQQTLDSLLRVRKNKNKFPIIISQDCSSVEMFKYLDELNLGDDIISIRNGNRSRLNSTYEAISRHYKWMFTQIFDKLGFDKIIVLEDDLIVSPDFFEYFETMSPLLDLDASLFCISAWNDNCKPKFLNPDSEQSKQSFYRTDFFPGLGWMLKKSFWNEIKQQWPQEYWDDYLRIPSIIKGKQCIRPELSRVKNIGEIGGATNNQIYENWIKNLTYNQDDKAVQYYKSYEITQLLEPQYTNNLKGQIENAQIIQFWEIDSFGFKNKTLRIVYKDIGDYNTLAITIRLIEDYREDVIRTSFKRIINFYYKTNLVFLTPQVIKW